MKRSKRIKKNILIIQILIISSIIFICFFLPPIKSYFNQEMNKDLIQKIENELISANIEIVQLKYRNGENHSSYLASSGASTSVSEGGSGVIIAKEGNRYFALTANHVILEEDDVDKTQIIAMRYDDLDFADYISEVGYFMGVDDYYYQFPNVTVEYANDKYDLVLISFMAEEEYSILPISDKLPKYGDIVVAMSNPCSERNLVSAGKISSRKLVTFNDEVGKNQYPMIQHTAQISQGSSGSALINQDFEIVGINLGGNENIFRQYISGMAMASDRIVDFLEESGFEFQ
ncbi:S1 family peptidase [Clostridium sp. DL1XJH146]